MQQEDSRTEMYVKPPSYVQTQPNSVIQDTEDICVHHYHSLMLDVGIRSVMVCYPRSRQARRVQRIFDFAMGGGASFGKGGKGMGLLRACP